MPLYEYRCPHCQRVFESFQSRTLGASEDPGADCPDCGRQSPRIAISATAEPIFKGSGFYETDYKKKPKLKEEG